MPDVLFDEPAKGVGEFDASLIRQALEKTPKVKDLPATNILADQLDKNIPDILTKLPNAKTQEIALSLAARFFKRSLYQRISEQAIFGPSDFERFDNQKDFEGKMPEISAGIDAASKLITEKRPNTHLLVENGWLYAEQGTHKTDYRIYLSPAPQQIGKVFVDLALNMPQDVQYQMKTFDRPTHPSDVTRMDKIIMYISSDNLPAVLKTLATTYKQNEVSFKDRPAPGGGIVSPADGISIGKQSQERGPDGSKVTGTQKVATEIEEALEKRLPEITRTRMGKYSNANEAGLSDEGKLLWHTMEVNQDAIARLWYLGENKPTKEQAASLSRDYLKALWTAALFHYTEHVPISVDQIRQRFIKDAAQNANLDTSQMQYLLTQQSAHLTERAVTERLNHSVYKTGLAIAFNEGLAEGKKPGETFKQLLA